MSIYPVDMEGVIGPQRIKFGVSKLAFAIQQAMERWQKLGLGVKMEQGNSYSKAKGKQK